MALNQLFKFLLRFEILGAHGSVIEKEALQWCVSKAGVDGIEIKLRRPNLIITSKSALAKSALFTMQNRLLEDLQKKFGSKAPVKIIFG